MIAIERSTNINICRWPSPLVAYESHEALSLTLHISCALSKIALPKEVTDHLELLSFHTPVRVARLSSLCCAVVTAAALHMENKMKNEIVIVPGIFSSVTA